MLYKYLFEILLSILFDMYPGVELLSHMTILFLIFWGTNVLLFAEALPFALPSTMHKHFNVSHTLTNNYYFLGFFPHSTTQIGVK